MRDCISATAQVTRESMTDAFMPEAVTSLDPLCLSDQA
jgi:hypothetical protein